MPVSPDVYQRAGVKADQLESELKRLQRWDAVQLPAEKFENMGAFGSNTMRFEQWLQFILIPTIRDIINTQGQFPEQSMLGTYAIRVFDGDADADTLFQLLHELDELIEGNAEPQAAQEPSRLAASDAVPPETISMGDTVIPPVLYALVAVLPQFEGADLESQLQTYDTFLAILSPVVRPEISRMLLDAAGRTTNETSRQRIKKAADSILNGGRAAEPYDHEEAMRKYREEHRKSYPS